MAVEWKFKKNLIENSGSCDNGKTEIFGKIVGEMKLEMVGKYSTCNSQQMVMSTRTNFCEIR